MRVYPQIHEVNKGKDIVIYCQSTDKVVWALPFTPPRQLVTDQLGGIKINKSQANDSGIYRCIGTGNDVFNVQAQLHVIGIENITFLRAFSFLLLLFY